MELAFLLLIEMICFVRFKKLINHFGIKDDYITKSEIEVVLKETPADVLFQFGNSYVTFHSMFTFNQITPLNLLSKCPTK